MEGEDEKEEEGVPIWEGRKGMEGGGGGRRKDKGERKEFQHGRGGRGRVISKGKGNNRQAGRTAGRGIGGGGGGTLEQRNLTAVFDIALDEKVRRAWY